MPKFISSFSKPPIKKKKKKTKFIFLDRKKNKKR